MLKCKTAVIPGKNAGRIKIGAFMWNGNKTEYNTFLTTHQKSFFFIFWPT
jgi:hypothetical protein